ncbi:MAG: family 1 glycosylhydrolase, partial [Phycisphaerales bacterium]|nr:family 1 glycosylhydrolase [Phycisphaerales bacterium]
MSFGNDFLWGAATSSYQIEGASSRRARCVWDDFCETEGKVKHGDHGNIACEHLDHMDGDVALMRRLGLKAYRFSIAWARVLPDGETVNEEGLDTYDRLVDLLLDAGIRPFVTLYHWDHPSVLEDRGGWRSPESPAWFERLADVVAGRLHDRVHDWMTINEPQVFLGLGLDQGTHAPGRTCEIAEVIRASHHVLCAHGRGAQAIRRYDDHARIGWAPVGVVAYPSTPNDIEAARERTFSIRADNVWNNTWFNDPVVFGHYPEDGLTRFGSMLPDGFETDLKQIRQPLSFYGVNIYHGGEVTVVDGETREVRYPVGGGRTQMDWPITPEALYRGPRFFYERYGLP